MRVVNNIEGSEGSEVLFVKVEVHMDFEQDWRFWSRIGSDGSEVVFVKIELDVHFNNFEGSGVAFVKFDIDVNLEQLLIVFVNIEV